MHIRIHSIKEPVSNPLWFFKALHFEIEYVPGDYKDLAMGVELNGRTLLKGEHVPLTAHLVLKVSSGDPNMLPDSLALDSIPVEPLDSDIENWF